MKKDASVISPERIAASIYFMRGQRVMLDSDLAKLYGVKTKSLNLAVKRNKSRFPEDFLFQLTKEETAVLRFQIETSKDARGGRRYLPYVFTEQGVAMLSSVLKSVRAIQMNIAIMRTFVRLRELLTTDKELAHKLAALERKIGTHDEAIRDILTAVRQMMAPPEKPKRQIGFHP
ncbi:MAG: ORF6N domain-containing protein [Candidatus Omnitrophica bacterium]|nr:ORF6N domain-containing protein [Candidatus Omnitrophota bacterium]